MLFLHFRLSEQAEVHAAVCPVLNESGHILKAVVLAVFEYEDAVGLQQSALKYQLGQGGQFGQGVGRIGKDEVELLMAALMKRNTSPRRAMHLSVPSFFRHCFMKA